jgi:hypothetical protein
VIEVYDPGLMYRNDILEICWLFSFIPCAALNDCGGMVRTQYRQSRDPANVEEQKIIVSPR